MIFDVIVCHLDYGTILAHGKDVEGSEYRIVACEKGDAPAANGPDAIRRKDQDSTPLATAAPGNQRERR